MTRHHAVELGDLVRALNSPNVDQDTWLRVDEVAKFERVNPRTVIRRIDDGTYPAVDLNPQGQRRHWRIPVRGYLAALNRSLQEPDLAG